MSKETYATVAWIEDDEEVAVLVYGDEEGLLSVDCPLSWLPEGVEEGDHFTITITLAGKSEIRR